MQITETNAEGLKHEFKVVVAANDIERQLTSRLTEIGRTARLPGFRPGKVPLKVLRNRFGTAVMGEVLQHAVSESSDQALRSHNLRPALQPKVEIVSFNEGADLEYKLAVEVLPEIQAMNFAELELERLTPQVPEEEVQSALERIARQQRKNSPVDRPAEKGDAVKIDFTGTIDGVEFAGGKATDYTLELGSGAFIPGFEDQLIGVKAGETRNVSVTFPADYGAAELAGKAANFEVVAKEVQGIETQPIDDSLGKAVGMEDLAELRKSVAEQIERSYADLARQRLKRLLLDKLAERHSFPVPLGMIDVEFEAIWQQYVQERDRAKEEGRAQNTESENEEETKAEYRAIAERRVRLGLLLAEVGRANNITVAQEELNRALAERARRFPGQERQVIQFYRDNPQALDQVRAPLYEDKVVDFILGMAKVTERSVPLSELLADEEGDEATEIAAPEAAGEAEQSEPTS